MARRSAVAGIVLLFASLAAMCAKRQVQVSPERTDLIVLLPDPDDTTVGRANVSTQSGAVELATAFDATRVTARRAPTPAVTMEKSDVEGMFRELLAGLPPAPRHFTLYFQFASDDLTTESLALTKEILELIKTRPSPDVILAGHTDTTGSAASNNTLGLQRATIVRDMLIAAGLDATSIVVTSHGEGDLLVRTPDETFEPRNRRVEIDIQ